MVVDFLLDSVPRWVWSETISMNGYLIPWRVTWVLGAVPNIVIFLSYSIKYTGVTSLEQKINYPNGLKSCVAVFLTIKLIRIHLPWFTTISLMVPKPKSLLELKAAQFAVVFLWYLIEPMEHFNHPESRYIFGQSYVKVNKF